MLFFDSFALIEIIKGNNEYKRYLEETIITTKLNLMELYYFLLREKNEEQAEFYYTFYTNACIPVTDDIVKEAMHLKLKLKGKKLSYIDCLGYITSLKLNIKFLTGDKEFKDLKNVVFVK